MLEHSNIVIKIKKENINLLTIYKILSHIIQIKNKTTTHQMLTQFLVCFSGKSKLHGKNRTFEKENN